MKACLFVSFVLAGLTAAAQIPSSDVQIKLATLAAPAELRDKALVYGYTEKGELVVLRKGENEMICLGDDPNQAGLNVSCYHKDLEPLMSRGRELKKEGKKNVSNILKETHTPT